VPFVLDEVPQHLQHGGDSRTGRVSPPNCGECVKYERLTAIK
jgi:hypothetical protein